MRVSTKPGSKTLTRSASRASSLRRLRGQIGKAARRTAPSALLALSAVACSAGVGSTSAEELGFDDTSQFARVQQAIVGGYVDDQTSGVVGLGIFEEGQFFTGHCSGTLILPNLVLTARHCITRISVEEDAGQVRCGETEFQRTRDPQSIVVSYETERPNSPFDPSFIRGRSLHPVPDADDLCGFDVALIILEESFPEDVATPIEPRVDRSADRFEDFSATGFGLTGDSRRATSGTRMRNDDKTIFCSRSECAAMDELVASTEWASLDAGVCSGDSGGPALDSEGRVFGVASRGGAGCQTTIYGDVAAWGDFVREIAVQAMAGQDYEVPEWVEGGDASTQLDLGLAETGVSAEDLGPDEVTGTLGREQRCTVANGATRSPSRGFFGVLSVLAFGLLRRRKKRSE